MEKTQTESSVPFLDSGVTCGKAKILLYGGYGTGKTRLSLRFPAPVVIDMERGTECYAGEFGFKVFQSTDTGRIRAGLEYLRQKRLGCETIVLDSMTEFWSALQSKWSAIFLRRNMGKGNKEEYYDLQPRDWVQIKQDFKDFLRLLLSLDMHVVCTCRVKELYSEGQMLKKVGETFDSDRSLPYMFDTVVRLDKTEGKCIATVEKDRTFSLPPKFDAHYIVFAAAFGLHDWAKLPIPDMYLPAAQRGKEITGENLANDECGRQLLRIWANANGNGDGVPRLLGMKLLEKFPSPPQPSPHGNGNGNGRWKNSPVRDESIPHGLRGKGYTWFQIATDPGICFETSDGNRMNGRQYLAMRQSELEAEGKADAANKIRGLREDTRDLYRAAKKRLFPEDCANDE